MERRNRARRGNGPDVLVVDGDPRDADVFMSALRRAGFAGHHLESGENVPAIVEEVAPAAVILEVSLPGTTGYEICRELRQRFGEALPIVFVSGERREARRSRRRAADRRRRLSRQAGRCRRADREAPPPDREDGRLTRTAVPAPPAFARLTTRESEVLRLLAHGLDQGSIARELAISPATVGTHIQRILTKLDVHSRTQAVALAYREKLVDQN